MKHGGMILRTEARRQFKHAAWLGFTLGLVAGAGIATLIYEVGK